MHATDSKPKDTAEHVTDPDAAGSPPRDDEAGSERPRAVVAAAVIAIIAAAGAITSSLPIWLGGGVFALGILQELSVGLLGLAYLLFAAIEVAVGAGLIAFAVGALKMRRWAWPLGLVLVSVGSLFWMPALLESDQAAAASWGFTTPLLGLPLLLALLTLLLVPSVRTALGHPPKERHSTHAVAH